MSGNLLLLPAIAAILVFLLFMVVSQLTNKKENIRERMERIVGEENALSNAGDASEFDDDVVEASSPLANMCDHILRAMGMDTETFRKESQLRFYRAGLGSYNAPTYYLFFKRIGIVFFVLIAAYLVFSDATGMIKLMHWLLAILLLFLGFFGGDTYLQNQRTKREKILQSSFPDALDLLLVCVESGLALDGSLARVCKELGHAHPEITQELNRTRLELTLLNNRPQALTNLAERTDMMAFRSLSTSLLQSERFGTSLTDTLRVLSDDYRQTRLMVAEDKAGRLPVMMTLPLIVLMMPALFLIILGPAILKVMTVMASR